MAEGYSSNVNVTQMQPSQYGHQYNQGSMDGMPQINHFEVSPMIERPTNEAGAGLAAALRELEVHNLDNVTYEEVEQLLSGIGEIESLEFPTSALEKGLSQPFASAYVKYKEANMASEAYRALNGQSYYGKNLILNFVNRNPEGSTNGTNAQAKPKWYRIFVGSLPRELDDNKLKLLFEPYGVVVEAKVVYEPQTKESRGFGFVTFETHAAAENAIVQMNDAIVDDKQLQTNWAILRRRDNEDDLRHHPKYHELYYATFPGNSTVYVGSLPTNLPREAVQKLLQAAFKRYGQVRKVVVSKCTKYAFITLDTKLSATLAILAMDGKALCGANDGPSGNFKTIRCSWANTQAPDPSVVLGRNYGYSVDASAQVPASTNSGYWSPSGGNRNRSNTSNFGNKNYQQNLIPTMWNAQDSYDHGRNQYSTTAPYGTYMYYAPNYNYRPNDKTTYYGQSNNAAGNYNAPATNSSRPSWTGNQSKFHHSGQGYNYRTSNSSGGGYSDQQRKSYSSNQSNDSFPNSGRN